MHIVMNLNYGWEIFLFFSLLQMWCPLYKLQTKESYQIWSVITGEVSFASLWIKKEQ